MKLFFSIFIFLFIVTTPVFVSAATDDSATTHKQSCIAGVRFQKGAGFYWTNGVSLEYSTSKIWNQKISFALNFVSSKLGTAAFSNAIPYYEINFSAVKYFRLQKKLKPIIRLNLGYAHANYNSDIFKDIPNQSMLSSIEAGAAYDFKFPLKIALTGGYNIITGNGSSGLGVLFPIYAQFSVFYRVF